MRRRRRKMNKRNRKGKRQRNQKKERIAEEDSKIQRIEGIRREERGIPLKGKTDRGQKNIRRMNKR